MKSKQNSTQHKTKQKTWIHFEG